MHHQPALSLFQARSNVSIEIWTSFHPRQAEASADGCLHRRSFHEWLSLVNMRLLPPHERLGSRTSMNPLGRKEPSRNQQFLRARLKAMRGQHGAWCRCAVFFAHRECARGVRRAHCLEVVPMGQCAAVQTHAAPRKEEEEHVKVSRNGCRAYCRCICPHRSR